MPDNQRLLRVDDPEIGEVAREFDIDANARNLQLPCFTIDHFKEGKSCWCLHDVSVKKS
jgi:hypothetical protein